MTPLSPSQFNETSATRLVELGSVLRQESTGRSWRYSLAGASDLARGKLTVQATVNSQRINLSFATAPKAGDKSVSVTIGTGAETADTYRDGWLVVQDGTGQGRAYPIAGHDAISASSAGTFNLKEAIDTDGATAETNVDLLQNEYAAIVISATDQADYAVGVPNVAIASGKFGWVQTYGACSVLMDEAVTNGTVVTIGTGTAGAVEALDGAGEQSVGIVAGTAGVDTEYQLVNLTIKY